MTYNSQFKVTIKIYIPVKHWFYILKSGAPKTFNHY